MAQTILFTGANSSLGLPAVSHLLSTYPSHTALLTVRDASSADPNTAKLRDTISRVPDAKAQILPLDLSSLAAVHAFADKLVADIAAAKIPPLGAIVANAYYWNLVGDPEITADGFDKTFEVTHVAHAALILRLLGSFGTGEGGRKEGRIVLLSSDSHWPGKNSMEKYPPGIPANNLAELIRPACDDDKQGRGYQRYATAKLAVTTWMYPLNRRLEKDPSLSRLTAVAINPGNLVDSRALTTNTPVSMHRMQRFLFRPLLPLLKLLMGPTLRTAGPAGTDVVELALSPEFAGKRGFYTLLREDESSPDSRDERVQEALWKGTLEWAGVDAGKTVLKGL